MGSYGRAFWGGQAGGPSPTCSDLQSTCCEGARAPHFSALLPLCSARGLPLASWTRSAAEQFKT